MMKGKTICPLPLHVTDRHTDERMTKGKTTHPPPVCGRGIKNHKVI